MTPSDQASEYPFTATDKELNPLASPSLKLSQRFRFAWISLRCSSSALFSFWISSSLEFAERILAMDNRLSV